LEESLTTASFPDLKDEIPVTIPTLEESDKLIEKAELDHVERAEADDIDELTLKGCFHKNCLKKFPSNDPRKITLGTFDL
jgi:hypothetical protein